MLSCFASLLTERGQQRVTKLFKGHPVMCGERLGKVALLSLGERRLKRDSGDGLQWGCTEEVQPGSSFSQGGHGGEEKSFHD